jgi:predicted Zn finger-like uncharacterized protein
VNAFLCPQCRAVFKVPDAAAGKTAKCPKCGQLLRLPAAAFPPSPLTPPTVSVKAIPTEEPILDVLPVDDPESRPNVLPATEASGRHLPRGKSCPSCGGADFRRVKPRALIAFTWDRICKACGTRYTPPTPLWAALLFILTGVLFGGLGASILLVGAYVSAVNHTKSDESPPLFPFGLIVVGALVMVHGVRCLKK